MGPSDCDHKWSAPVMMKNNEWEPKNMVVISCEKCGEIKKEKL